MTASAKQAIDIAVGVLVDARGQVLIARRRVDTPGAGFWEFPGGKREAGEAIETCLARELAEEIGVSDIQGAPLIRFAHDRGPRPVRLHVWRIDAWQGEPEGCEGQAIRWADPASLDLSTLLPATEVILDALRLPQRYLITPEPESAETTRWQSGLAQALAAGIRLLRVRAPQLDDSAYETLARAVVEQAHAAGAQVLVDRDVSLMERVAADGLHWPAQRLIEHGTRPIGRERWCAVSAHSADEIQQAATLGANFATLSPVSATTTHPQATPLGWPGFARCRADIALPVLALGGLSDSDLDQAREHNAQGVAAIRGFWPGA